MITAKLEIPTFPGLTEKEVTELYRDGRVASKFLEVYFARLFKWELVDAKNYDFLTPSYQKVEFKTLTKRGCNFLPSRMKGSSRKVDSAEAEKVIIENLYLICDIRLFPVIRYKLYEGKELLRKYPKYVIKEL